MHHHHSAAIQVLLLMLQRWRPPLTVHLMYVHYHDKIIYGECLCITPWNTETLYTGWVLVSIPQPLEACSHMCMYGNPEMHGKGPSHLALTAY